MTVPLIALTEEDIRRICTEAMATMDQTENIVTSTSLADLDQHLTHIEQSQSALETLEGFLKRQINGLKNSLDAVDAMQKDLTRHEKRSTRSYWQIRNSTPKS